MKTKKQKQEKEYDSVKEYLRLEEQRGDLFFYGAIIAVVLITSFALISIILG